MILLARAFSSGLLTSSLDKVPICLRSRRARKDLLSSDHLNFTAHIFTLNAIWKLSVCVCFFVFFISILIRIIMNSHIMKQIHIDSSFSLQNHCNSHNLLRQTHSLSQWVVKFILTSISQEFNEDSEHHQAFVSFSQMNLLLLQTWSHKFLIHGHVLF